MSLWLDNAEIVELTEKKRPSAQIKVLRSLCIDHRLRPDGSIVVLKSALGEQKSVSMDDAQNEPDMSAI